MEDVVERELVVVDLSIFLAIFLKYKIAECLVQEQLGVELSLLNSLGPKRLLDLLVDEVDLGLDSLLLDTTLLFRFRFLVIIVDDDPCWKILKNPFEI